MTEQLIDSFYRNSKDIPRTLTLTLTCFCPDLFLAVMVYRPEWLLRLTGTITVDVVSVDST